jgi:hypothetical protein
MHGKAGPPPDRPTPHSQKARMTSTRTLHAPLRAWSDEVVSHVDSRLYAAMEAQRALNRAPYALLESRGPLAPPIEAAVRWQDAMTRLTYHSLVTMNRLAGALSVKFIDALDPQTPKGD